MVYIYLPAAYYHLNLDVTKDNLLAAGFSAVPAVFLVVFIPGMLAVTCTCCMCAARSLVSWLGCNKSVCPDLHSISPGIALSVPLCNCIHNHLAFMMTSTWYLCHCRNNVVHSRIISEVIRDGKGALRVRAIPVSHV